MAFAVALDTFGHTGWFFETIATRDCSHTCVLQLAIKSLPIETTTALCSREKNAHCVNLNSAGAVIVSLEVICRIAVSVVEGYNDVHSAKERHIGIHGIVFPKSNTEAVRITLVGVHPPVR